MLFEEQVSIKAIILDEKNHFQILSPPYNDNSFCPESVFCPFDSWLTYFAAMVIIEYWKIFQWLRLRRPNVFTRFFVLWNVSKFRLRPSLTHSTPCCCNANCCTEVKYNFRQWNFEIKLKCNFFAKASCSNLLFLRSLVSGIDPRYPL